MTVTKDIVTPKCIKNTVSPGSIHTGWFLRKYSHHTAVVSRIRFNENGNRSLQNIVVSLNLDQNLAYWEYKTTLSYHQPLFIHHSNVSCYGASKLVWWSIIKNLIERPFFQAFASKLLCLTPNTQMEQFIEINPNSKPSNTTGNNQMINHKPQEFTNTWPTKHRHDINKADYNIVLQ